MLPVILQDHEMKEERKPVPVAANETDKTPTSSKPEWRESWPKLLNVPSDISHLIVCRAELEIVTSISA